MATKPDFLALLRSLSHYRVEHVVVGGVAAILVGDLEVRVLDLAAVIESKQAAGREKDVAMLPVLLRTLEERDR